MGRKLVGPCSQWDWCDGMLWATTSEDVIDGIPMTTLVVEHTRGIKGRVWAASVTEDGMLALNDEWRATAIENLLWEIDRLHFDEKHGWTPQMPEKPPADGTWDRMIWAAMRDLGD